MNTLNFQATLSIDGNGNYMTFYFTIRNYLIPLVTHLAILFTHKIAFAVRLEHRNDFGQPLIPHVFQFSQDASAEEYLNAVYDTQC